MSAITCATLPAGFGCEAIRRGLDATGKGLGAFFDGKRFDQRGRLRSLLLFLLLPGRRFRAQGGGRLPPFMLFDHLGCHERNHNQELDHHGHGEVLIRGKRRGFRVRHAEQAGKRRALAVGFEDGACLLDLLPERHDIGIELCRPIGQRLVPRHRFKAGKRLAFRRFLVAAARPPVGALRLFRLRRGKRIVPA